MGNKPTTSQMLFVIQEQIRVMNSINESNKRMILFLQKQNKEFFNDLKEACDLLRIYGEQNE